MGELTAITYQADMSSLGGTKSATATISFYEATRHNTWPAGTGNRVTLENVVINTYDIDIYQFQVFKGSASHMS